MKKLFVLIMGLLFLSSCAGNTSKVQQDSVFLGEHYQKLQPGTEETDPKLMWMKPGVDYKKYDKIMVDYVIFAFAEDSEYKGIDANELKKLADSASEVFVRTIGKDFPVVSEPAPDVLRIRVAITDLKQSSPGLSAVTSIVPVGLAVSLVKKGSSDSWTGSGATTAEMLVVDSMTNEVLAAGQDTLQAEFEDRFSKWGSAEEAFTFWAERFTKRLNTLLK